MDEPLDLTKTYVVLSPEGEATRWISSEFWAMAFDKTRLENNPKMGYLVSSYEFTKDWDSWEKHPIGDEVVTVLRGKMEFVFEEDGREVRRTVGAGETIVVPRGTWHTAKVREPSKVIFVTFGYGTEHRPA